MSCINVNAEVYTCTGGSLKSQRSAEFSRLYNLHPWHWNSLSYSLISSGENSAHFLQLTPFTIMIILYYLLANNHSRNQATCKMDCQPGDFGWPTLSFLGGLCWYIGLTLTVLNFWKFTSYCSLKSLWSGMGEVVPARTSPTLHPPSLPLCINCRD